MIFISGPSLELFTLLPSVPRHWENCICNSCFTTVKFPPNSQKDIIGFLKIVCANITCMLHARSGRGFVNTKQTEIKKRENPRASNPRDRCAGKEEVIKANDENDF